MKPSPHVARRRRSGLPAGPAALALALALWASACAVVQQPSVEEQQAFDAAVVASSSDPDEAARQLEVFLRNYPSSPLAEEAADRRAQLALAVGDRSKASFWLRWIVRNHPSGERSDDARVELARLAFQEGDLDTVRFALEDVRASRLAPPKRRLSYRLRAETEADPVLQLRWLAKSREVAVESDVKPESMRLIDAELARAVDELSALELLRAADELDGRPPAGRVSLRLAELNMDAGDWDHAEDELEAAQRLELGESETQLLAALQQRFDFFQQGRGDQEPLPAFADVVDEPRPSTAGATGTIAVLVPMSGPLAYYGEASLRGVLLAAGLFDEMPPLDVEGGPGALGEPLPSARSRTFGPSASEVTTAGPGVRVIVHDTAGDPSRAAEAVRASAADEDVVAIIGPLRSSACEAAAAAADEVGVPLLALSTRVEIARNHSFAFRVRMTPADELRYLVDYAFDKQGARRFAVLHPDDSYGRGMRDEFWDMVVQRGGWMVAVAAYPPDATDFADPIRQMVGYPLLTNAEQVALNEREAFLRRSRRLKPRYAQLAQAVAKDLVGPEAEPLPPIVDFDALFIPDVWDHIALIAPQLAFHEVLGVKLLGVGDWMNPELLDLAGKHVDGAVISSSFDPSSRFPFVATLVDEYEQVFDAEPDVFAAQAYDAANLVLAQLAGGRFSGDDAEDIRERVRDGLLRTRVFPGASGVTRIDPDGNARKRPFLLEVTPTGFTPLD